MREWLGDWRKELAFLLVNWVPTLSHFYLHWPPQPCFGGFNIYLKANYNILTLCMLVVLHWPSLQPHSVPSRVHLFI